MKQPLDIDKIAKGLGAERRGTLPATGGYVGAMQLAAEVQAKFRVPKGGGRPTDPTWTERRSLPLTVQTLKRLERLAKKVAAKQHLHVEPMQIAALLLKKTIETLREEEVVQLIERHSAHRR